MPVIDTCSETFQQHLFLGISVQEINANAGWGQQSSDLTVTLVEDPCTSTAGKICYDTDLEQQIIYTADPGFLGEDRYQRTDGSEYSACEKENPSDTLIRSAIDIIGLPAYFRLGNFEYSGIISDYNRSVGSQGTTYRVKLVDPREILDGIHLILGDYAGAVYQTGNINVYNIYGFMEQFGAPAPTMELTSPCLYTNTSGDTTTDGATFGTYSGGFGGSFVNENGMPLPLVLNAFNMMANALPIHSTALPFVGSLDGINPIPFVSYYGKPLGGVCGGLIEEDDAINHLSYYRVDLSELPILGGYLNRIEGTVVSLLDLIEKVVSEAGMDYYVELIPVKHLGSIYKFIKVRVVDRTAPPTADQICSYISNQENVVDYNIGRELRIETSGGIVVGANKQSIYQACSGDNPDGGADDELTSIAIDVTGLNWSQITITGCPAIDDMILPYFGKHPNGDLIVPCTGEYGWEFDIDTTDINSEMSIPTIRNPLTITELELRAALSGYESFKNVIEAMNSEIYQDVYSNTVALHEVQVDQNIVNAGEKPAPRDWLTPKKKKFFKLDLTPEADFEQKLQNDQQQVYDMYLKYARDFYGKKFAVRIPNTTAWLDYENRRAVLADQPTNDGGWTEASSVIGLSTSSYAMNFFRDDVGKIQAFVKFSNTEVTGETKVLNISYLDPDTYLYGTEDGNPYGALYIKSEVDEKYVFHDADLYYGPRVIVTIPQAVYDAKPGDDGEKVRLDKLRKLKGELANDPTFAASIESAFKDVGGKDSLMPLELKMHMPDAAAIPIYSNVLSYGPFYYGSTGVPGKVNIKKDDFLAPWNYGSFANMNTAGIYTAGKEVSAMKAGELGSITIVGYPTIPLGAELGAVSGGAYSSDEYLLENRSVSSTNISNINYSGSTVSIDYDTTTILAGPWSGSYGPNITNISVSIGVNGATTTYTMRSFAPRKRLLDRKILDQIVKNRLEAKRIILNKITKFNKREQKSQLFKFGVDDERYNPRGEIENPGTPHEVFCGQIVPFANGQYERTLITTSKMSEVSLELQHSYENKAFMSIDGLLRPVSMDGSGGLPRYIQPSGYTTCPIYIGDSECNIIEESELTQMVIDIDHLNPFSNPTAFNRSTVVSERSDTPNIGHDIDVVGRTGDDDGAPSEGLIMPIAGISSDYTGDYQDDYRIMALKGPLLIQQWGYDLYDKPVPNKVDTEENASQGIFADSALQCKFMDNWLRKPSTWPVAPLDLRLDRERGVWVTKSVPDPDDIIIGTACTDVVQGTPFKVMVTWPILTDCDGNAISNPIVYGTSETNREINAGDNVILKKTDNCFLVIECDSQPGEGGGGGGCSIIHRVFPFETMECVVYGQTTFTGREMIINEGGGLLSGTEMHEIKQIWSEYGPAPTGFRGWAVEVIECISGEETSNPGNAYLINLEHFARYVTVPDITGIQTPSNFWDGHNPGGQVSVNAGCYSDYDSSCIECAVASFIPEASTCTDLQYRVIDVKGGITHTNTDECITSPNTPAKINHSVYSWGKGLDIREDDCTLKIGSYVKINGAKSNDITFSNCFTVIGGTCSSGITLNAPTGDIALEVVIPPIECISGEIFYDTVVIHTSCGLITAITE